MGYAWIYDLQFGSTGAHAHTPEWRRTSTDTSFVILDGTVWQVASNVVSCSDASIAPIVTSTARQLTGLAAALPARARSTDVRGNSSEATLEVSAPTATEVQDNEKSVPKFSAKKDER